MEQVSGLVSPRRHRRAASNVLGLGGSRFDLWHVISLCDAPKPGGGPGIVAPRTDAPDDHVPTQQTIHNRCPGKPIRLEDGFAVALERPHEMTLEAVLKGLSNTRDVVREK